MPENKMNNTGSSVTKPFLFHGKYIPISALSPDSFEDFMTGALRILGGRIGLKDVIVTGQTGDGGFDIEARNATEEIVCGQCKNLKNRFEYQGFVEELAKVALNAKFKDFSVAEHWFFCSGTVSQSIRDAIRVTSRTKLIESVERAVRESNSFSKIRSQIPNINTVNIATDYINGLKKVQVWSGRDINTEISISESQFIELIGKHFQVEHVLLEYPRPDFDERSFVRGLQEMPNTVSLEINPAGLPDNLQLASNADPIKSKNKIEERDRRKLQTVDDIISNYHNNKSIVIVGKSGSGKTTTLRRLARLLADDRSSVDESPLPILLNLADYSQSLESLIHQSLHIRHGNWVSLPGSFFLLLDGLDDCSDSNQARILSELTLLLNDSKLKARCAALISIGESGLARPHIFDSIVEVYSTGPLTVQQMYDLAEITFGAEIGRIVTVEALKIHGSKLDFLALPFNFAWILGAYKASKKIPVSAAELIRSIMNDRYSLFKERSLGKTYGDLPFDSFVDISSRIALKLVIHERSRSWGKANFRKSLLQAKQDAVREGVYGISAINELDFERLFVESGVFVTVQSEDIRFSHGLVGEYLAGLAIQRSWKEYSSVKGLSDSMWISVSDSINESERKELLESIVTLYPIAAAQIAKANGAAFQAQILPRLSLLMKQAQSEFQIVSAYLALGHLGTSEARKILISEMVNPSPKNENVRKSMASRGLAVFGDEEYLRGIFDKAEKDASNQFIRISSNEIFLWRSAPLDIRLKLSRERIKVEFNAVKLSIETIRAFGSKDDIEAIEIVLAKTNQTNIAALCIYILHKADSEKVESDITERLENETNENALIFFAEIALEIGMRVKPSRLLNLIGRTPEIDEAAPHEQLQAALTELSIASKNGDQAGLAEAKRKISILRRPADTAHLKRKMSDVLKKADFADEDISHLVESLKKCAGLDMELGLLWSVAKEHPGESVFEYIRDTIDAIPLNHLWYVCELALSSVASSEFKQFVGDHLLKRVKNDENYWRFPFAGSLIDLLNETGGEVKALLHDYSDRVLNNLSGAIESGSAIFDFVLPWFIPVMARFIDQLSEERVRILMRLYSPSLGLEGDMTKIAKQLSQKELDDMLTKIFEARDYHRALWFLRVLVPIESSLVRQRVLEDLLVLFCVHPAGMHECLEVMRNIGGEEALSITVSAVLRMRWPALNGSEVGDQFFNDMRIHIAEIIQSEVSQSVARTKISEKIQTKGVHPVSLKILQWWLDLT